MEYQSHIGQNGAAFTAGNPAPGRGNRKPANVQQLVRENARHIVQLGGLSQRGHDRAVGKHTHGVDGGPDRTTPASDTHKCFQQTAKQTDEETLSCENYLLISPSGSASSVGEAGLQQRFGGRDCHERRQWQAAI